MQSARAILIAGPTASGKSGLAVALAERLGGTVINADSMQVYRDLRILTARPTPEDEARVPHALYGFVSGAEAYSAGRYAADVATAIADARADARVPVVVGGTGLYFKVLLEGLSPVPATDPQVRAFWRAEAARRPAPELHALLAERDAATAARLMPTDPQRIVRALEVLESTGRSLAEWQRQPGRPVLREDETVRLLVLPERAAHGALIDARFDAMMAGGALEEVRRLVSLGLSAELPIMRALGVAPLAAHTAGTLALDEAASIAKGDFRAGERLVGEYRAARGVTPEMLEALSWLGRGALAAKRFEQADEYARQTYDLATATLKPLELDVEPHLPIALGAAIEVRAQASAQTGARSEAVAFLQRELASYKATSIAKRIQKNLNLLSLEGTPAPPLDLSESLGRTPIPLSALKGKVVLLFFWAHWCSDCKLQGPVLEQLAGTASIRQDQLESVKPTPVSGNSKYPETRVQVTLRSATSCFLPLA